MEAVVHLDTHVVIWLYAGHVELLSEQAKRLIEAHTLVISPLVILELAYLKETNRLHADPHDIISDLQDRLGLRVDTTALALVVDQAVHMGWTRDPFDRLMTAQAASYDQVLLTKDDVIRQHYAKAMW